MVVAVMVLVIVNIVVAAVMMVFVSMVLLMVVTMMVVEVMMVLAVVFFFSFFHIFIDVQLNAVVTIDNKITKTQKVLYRLHLRRRLGRTLSDLLFAYTVSVDLLRGKYFLFNRQCVVRQIS